MNVFTYDKTFEGLLTSVFEAYDRKLFPDVLSAEQEPLPLFYNEVIHVITDETKSNRVWKGLQKKLSPAGLSVLTTAWLSELPEIDILLFRYMRKAINAPQSIELNFGDPDVLQASQIGKKVSQERMRVIQFLRFQKAADGTFFAALEPLYNVLPIAISHFQDRFADQTWLIYDLKREYGYFYDQTQVTEVRFETREAHLLTGKLNPQLMDRDEQLFQKLWKEYFTSISIKARKNPKLHRQNLPARFWKYLPEKN